MTNNKIAVVTGANKGIGFEICRQLANQGIRVILTARDDQKGQGAAERLRKEGLDVEFHQLDVTDETSIQRVVRYIKEQYGRLDILINNAGIFIDQGNHGLEADIDKIRETMETNAYGPLRVCNALIPIMRRENGGRIINVSSTMGMLTQMDGRHPGYRMSKTALNAVTLILASELKDTNIIVNAMYPGWVRTGMGGPNADRSVEEGADTTVWLATADNLPSGRIFKNRKEIEW